MRAVCGGGGAERVTGMKRVVQLLKTLLGRWSRQQETALWQMTERETANKRLTGFSKSKRIDAKFFLLAFAPFLPVMISDQLGWSRSTLWHIWLWLSVFWAVAIIGIGFASYWRTLRRSLDRKR